MSFLYALKRRGGPHAADGRADSAAPERGSEPIEPQLRAGTGVSADRLDPETLQMVETFEDLYRGAAPPENTKLRDDAEENPFADITPGLPPPSRHADATEEGDGRISASERRTEPRLAGAALGTEATDHKTSIHRAMEVLRAAEARGTSRSAARAAPRSRDRSGRTMWVVTAAVALLIGFAFGYVAGRGSDVGVPRAVSHAVSDAPTRLRLDYKLEKR